jgi:transcriptional regulator EpsA
MNAMIETKEIERRTIGHGRRFVDMVTESIEIKTQAEFFAWVRGALQNFLPHEVMIAAWGDFALGIIYFDVISSIPDIHSEMMREDGMVPFLKRLYSYWMSKDRTPSHLRADQGLIRCRDIQDAQLKASMQNMKSALIHAIKDVRGGSDSFYVLLSSDTDISSARNKNFHQLLPYIDTTLRQIEHFPAHVSEEDAEPDENLINVSRLSIEGKLKLSDRETEIMAWVCAGKTNPEIGLILDISQFTVKNHLQRIFKKLDVVNRSQAVAKIRGQISFAG